MLARVLQPGHEYSEGQKKIRLFPIRKEVFAFWKVAPSPALTLYAMRQINQQLETAFIFNQDFLKDATDNREKHECILDVHISLAFLLLQTHIQMSEIKLH